MDGESGELTGSSDTEDDQSWEGCVKQVYRFEPGVKERGSGG